MELPPASDALVDSFNVISTRDLEGLSKAEWAHVKRDEHLRIVRERKRECESFSAVVRESNVLRMRSTS